MIRRIVKQYTPTWRALDTPIEQARAIQDLYDQVRIFYDYLNDPNFDISHTGKPGPPGPPGPQGMSSFEVWKTIPGNEDKTIEDYFNEIKFDPSAFHGSSKIVNIVSDIAFSETTEDNTQINIIYLNNSDSDKNIIIVASSIYKTPDGKNIEINIPPGGYGEVNILNINGIMFVRGS